MMNAAFANPKLARSQLQFRLGLVRRRMESYPLHSLDFIMMDLERPELSSRHAHWCTGDLSGRTLEFLSSVDGIDGVARSPRLGQLFERIWRTRRKSGLFGKWGVTPGVGVEPEDWITGKPTPKFCLISGADRLFSGLITYYEKTGDFRGLEGAIGVADWFVANLAHWKKRFDGCRFSIEFWITEPMTRLYAITGNEQYREFVAILAEAMTFERSKNSNLHSHTFLSAMRGLQRMALHTGDMSWAETPEKFRRGYTSMTSSNGPTAA